MTWKPTDILTELRKLHEQGQSLSYRALGRVNRPLLSAAVYRFGSYRKAVENAGIEYDQFMRRPRWTRQGIIELIRSAQERREDLNWAAVTSRDDELRRAAYASLQRRLFGSWSAALDAAGVNAVDARSYRQWDRESIVDELRKRHASDAPMSSSAVQREDASLHAAALRHFGTYDAALRGADLDPGRCRVRRRWSRPIVLDALRRIAGEPAHPLDDASVRNRDAALHRATVRLFGSVENARRALQPSHATAPTNGSARHDPPDDARSSSGPSDHRSEAHHHHPARP